MQTNEPLVLPLVVWGADGLLVSLKLYVFY